jgi:hypothetical protein
MIRVDCELYSVDMKHKMHIENTTIKISEGNPYYLKLFFASRTAARRDTGQVMPSAALPSPANIRSSMFKARTNGFVSISHLD